MSCWKLVLLELSSSVGIEKSVPIFAFWVAVYILLSPFVALGYWLAPNGMQVAVGDVIYIEANSGAVKRVGRCDSFATEYDLEAEEYVPIPKGEVHKKKEIVQVPLWCYFNLKFHFRKQTFHNLKNEVIITGTSGGSARGVGHAVASSQPMHVPCKITVFVPRWLGSSITPPSCWFWIRRWLKQYISDTVVASTFQNANLDHWFLLMLTDFYLKYVG